MSPRGTWKDSLPVCNCYKNLHHLQLLPVSQALLRVASKPPSSLEAWISAALTLVRFRDFGGVHGAGALPHRRPALNVGYRGGIAADYSDLYIGRVVLKATSLNPRIN